MHISTYIHACVCVCLCVCVCMSAACPCVCVCVCLCATGCQVGEEESSPMWIMVLVGNIIRGIGEATIGPLGVAFIDDFARPENSAFYIGRALSDW